MKDMQDIPRKKLLVLTSRFIYPQIGGDRLRIYHICRELSKDYDLTLLSMCDNATDLVLVCDSDGIFKDIHRVYLPKWRSYLNCLFAILGSCPLQIAYYKSSKFRDLLESLLASHDMVLAHLIRTGDYIKYTDKPKILEMTDAISLNYSRVKKMAFSGGIKNLIYALEQGRLERYEKKTLRLYDLSVLVSDVDKRFLVGDKEAKNVLVCSNGVDGCLFPFNKTRNSREIVFIGNLDTVQNFDAAKWFASEVFLKLDPSYGFTFKIVGKISPAKKDMLGRIPGVEVTGTVADVAGEVRNSMIAVCPIRMGAGVQNKILEYMSLGIPVITSTISYRGLNIEENKHVLVADNPAQYLEKIRFLVENRAGALRLAINAREFVELKHDWAQILSVYRDRMRKVLE